MAKYSPLTKSPTTTSTKGRNRLSPSPSSPRKSFVKFLKSPCFFYLAIISFSFAAGYLAKTGIELWQVISKIRSADGHDITAKHIRISAPTNSEPRELVTLNVRKKPALHLSKTDAKIVKVPTVHHEKVVVNCSSCSLGPCQEPDPGTYTEISTEIQVFLSMQFPCAGVVTHWKLIDYNPSPNKKVYIDIIRYDKEKDQGTWMGYNAIVTNGDDGWVTYSVPEPQQLTVERGWLIAIHYDDVNVDGVVPHVESAQAGLKLYDGFGILMDHQELGRTAKLREPSQVPITAALKQLLVELKQSWRSPALVAIVEPF